MYFRYILCIRPEMSNTFCKGFVNVAPYFALCIFKISVVNTIFNIN